MGGMSDPPSPPPASPTDQPAAPRRQLTLFDSTCIIVGIIIGAGIFETTPLIASNVPNAWWLIAAWILGGLLSLVGALCYAELATAYPEEGGDYVYLTRSFGRWIGFLFAWAQLWVVRPGSIGAMAYVFGRYANQIWPRAHGAEEPLAQMLYAIVALVVLTDINSLGVREGKWTQNLLTTAKVLGLVGIFVAGMYLVSTRTSDEAVHEPAQQTASQPAASSGDGSPEGPSADEPGLAEENSAFDLAAFGLAMIFVLFTYGGWNEMAYVGAEVRDPAKNILRALVLGTVAVTLVYVLASLAFVLGLGFEGTQEPENTVAEDVFNGAAENMFNLTERRSALEGELEQLQGETGADASGRVEEIEKELAWFKLPGHLMSLLICISALGAVNGMIFTGARIYYAMGTDYRLFSWLGQWSSQLGTPVWSLRIQERIALALVIGFGLTGGGFASMVKFTTPVFWVFFLLVGVSLFVLRYREPDTPRPYRVLWYPVIPIVFCLSSSYMIYASLVYAIENRSWEAFWSVALLLVGVVLCFFNRPRRESQASR